MGYDIHITRRESWSAAEGPSITLAEWRAIVESDPKLKSNAELAAEARQSAPPVMIYDPFGSATHVVPFVEWQLIGNKNLQPDPQEDDLHYVAMFDPSNQVCRVFCYSDGTIFVTKPCTDVLMKMLSIAQKLNARVIGEHDEVYAPDGTPSHEPGFIATDRW